ncbi:MAG: hypothetical protein Kow00124_26350 [Anaerolineae bacterium]
MTMADFERMLAALAAADEKARANAAIELAEFGAYDEPMTPAMTLQAVAALIPALADPAREVRWAAAYALGALQDPGGVAPLAAALEEAASSGDGGLQLVIVKALGKIGNPAGIPALRRMLDHEPTACIRAAADRALTRIAAAG